MSKARKKRDKGVGTITFDLRRFEPNRDLQGLYNYLNKTWFDFQLPYVRCGYYNYSRKAIKKDGKEYGSTIRLFGARFPHYILLNPELREWNNTIEMTLLHEMTHVKMYVTHGEAHGHGPAFKKEFKTLIRRGAFDELL